MHAPSFRRLRTFFLLLSLVILSCSLPFMSGVQTATPNIQTNQPGLTTKPAQAVAATYYVRTDGGTAAQCDGLIDAAYSDSSTGPACAWSHPFWALDENGSWKLQPGDTLVIGPGSYKMGFGADVPNTAWCSQDYPWDCRLPALPSGLSAEAPTRLLGAGSDSGCSQPPELWGTERASSVLDLTNTSNAVVSCLEITDHSGCAMDHCNAAVKCERDSYPYGDYADQGLIASDSSQVTLSHLDIHGLANGGILAARLTDWSLEDVRLAGNGWVGWNGDLGLDESSDSGTLSFRWITVEWNGCPESYPGQQPAYCWGQELCGGYGDGFGETRTGGHWVIEDSIFRYNTSDGLDLLYVGLDHPGTLVEVRRSSAYGNAGNQFKIGGASLLVNSLAVGNCAFFYQKPYARDMGPLDSGNYCRAGGGAISVNLSSGVDAYLVNDTVASQGWADVELQCNTKDFPDQPVCTNTQRVWIQNSVFLGYAQVMQGSGQACSFIGDGDPDHFTNASSVDYNLIFNADISSPVGAHTWLSDPLIANAGLETFDGHLQAGSPAIDVGLPVGSLNGLVPADDLDLHTRPLGSGVDLGAFEWANPAGWTRMFLALVRGSGYR